MNTLIVAAYNVKSYSRGIMLDQLSENLEAKISGDKIYYLNCSNSFDTCYFNFDGDPGVCFSCRINANHNLKLVPGDFEHISFNDILRKEDIEKAEAFFESDPDIDFNTKYESFEIGESLLSVYISNTRNRDLAQANRNNYVITSKVNSLALYLAIKRFLKERKIDKVISFNGRQDYKRAVLRACEAVDIDCFNYERTRPGGYIEFFKNALPQNIQSKTEWINLAWQDPQFTLEEKTSIGAQFFSDKRAGKAIVDKTYVSGQQKGLIPEEVRNCNRNIILFNSSDDEFAAVGKEYQNPFFNDQLEGLRYIVGIVGRQMPEYNLVIRMHPNLKGIQEDYATGILLLHKAYPNIYVIPPDSFVDSYALLDVAEKVIVFGSSIGIEANFWRKPVILLAKSFYWLLDVAYIPKDKEEIAGLLKSALEPKNIEGSLKYGMYALKGGIKSKGYYQDSPTSTPLFKGKRMNDYNLKIKVIGKVLTLFYKVFNLKLKLKWIK